jgi:DNA-binding transcriptional LysR family regulator
VNNLTLRQLRAFRAVAAAGSFTDAAERLHLTPAALSGLIKELESQLGVRVFDRSTRKVTLSAVGEEFFPLTERVLQDLDDAVNGITNLKEKRRGIVRLAAPEVMSCSLVPPAMAAFRELHPQVELRFLDVPIDEVVRRTARGEVDLGIAPGPFADPEVKHTPFMHSPLRLAVPRNDILARRSQVGWEDVRRRRFVTFFRNFAEWAPAQFGATSESLLPQDVLLVQRINTALAMVKAGFGVTVCPVYAIDLAEGFALKLVKLGRPEVHREYSVLVRADHSLAPAAEAFRAFLLDFAPKWAKGLASTPR